MRAAANEKGEKHKELQCLNGHGPMKHVAEIEKVDFRGVELDIDTDIYECQICGLKAGTDEQAANIQLKIADAYRKKKGLLTSKEIKTCRATMNLSQAKLAKEVGVGVASIKRWETGAIQNASMDNLLRTVLKCEVKSNNPMNGNRELSLPRVKLVLQNLQKLINRILLKNDDKFLYTAKYIFYIDMLAYRDLGKSMTGATYAWLPHGPQLNNYRDLVDEILASDESEAEPLSEAELKIVERVAHRFPRERDAYHSSHKEDVLRNKSIGSLIFYTDANELS